MAKLVTFLIALMNGLIGIVILPLGLATPVTIILPLTLGVIALLAAVSASWSSTLLLRDRTHSRLRPILAVAAITAAVIAILILLLMNLTQRLPPLILLFALSTIIIAFSASSAAWRFRRPVAPPDSG